MPVRPPAARFAFIGGYTTPERGARGRGIITCRIEAGDGAWTPVGELTDIDNPSYLIADATRLRLYVAHGDRDYVTALAIHADSGALRPISRSASGGDNGVHLTLDPSGFLIVANHDSGSLGLLPVTAEGGLQDCIHCCDLAELVGQAHSGGGASHPHQAIFDPSGAFLLTPDKGLDRVFTFRLDRARCRLTMAGFATFPPGSGPRHLAFHPQAPWTFVVNELNSTLTACAWDAGSGVLTPRHRLSTLPDGFSGPNTAAAIVIDPDGEMIHVTNRGHDSIARFQFNAAHGVLLPAGWTSSGGATPRFMTVSPGGDLIVANEQGDSLFRFDLGGGAGELLLRTPSPSTIAFL